MEGLLDSVQVAELLRLPVRTLDQWRYLGKGPKYIKVGRHVRYTPAAGGLPQYRRTDWGKSL